MPCKIKIKQHVENLVEQKSQPGLSMSLQDAQILSANINSQFMHHVVSFKNENDVVKRVIDIPSKLVDMYYDLQVKKEVIKTPTVEIKPGIQELFDSNPELANIGTAEQYSAYLDSIFPDSKVKDIVYRGAEKGIETHKAYSHWTLRKALAENFAKQGVNLNKKDESKNTVYFALLNIKNLIRSIDITDEEHKESGFDAAASFPNQQKPDGTYYDNEEANESIQLIDKSLNNEITVFESEQIHILGTKEDIEGFKKFNNNKQDVSGLNSDINSLNLTPEVVNYLYRSSRSKSKNVSLESYTKEVKKLIDNLRTSYTNEEILEKIKCL
jgi:hypothetical protein